MIPRVSVLGAALLASCLAPPSGPEPKGEDAAPIYRCLIGRFPKLPRPIAAAFLGDPADPAEVDQALEAHRPLLADLVRATRARTCIWSYERPPSICSEYPLDYILTAARLLVVRARRELKNHHPKESLEDLEALSNLGTHLLVDRWTIGHLLGLICQCYALVEFQKWIRERVPDRTMLVRMEAHLERLIVPYPPFLFWLRTEREMALPLLEEVRDLGLSEVLRRVSGGSVGLESHFLVDDWTNWLRETLKTDFDRSRERISRRWDEILAHFEEDLCRPLNSKALSLRLAEFKKGTKDTCVRIARKVLAGGVSEDLALRDAADVLFALWVPSLDRMPERHTFGWLLLKMTRLACQLELHYLANGSYPEKLGDLAEAPVDPFSGQPVQYRHVLGERDEGYVLAAAGPADDALERIRVLSEECGFDTDLFEKKGYSEAYWTTFGTVRTR